MNPSPDYTGSCYLYTITTNFLIRKRPHMSAENNEKEVLLKIELQSFSNAIALDMGIRIVELARSRKQAIAVEISRLNQSVFLYVEDGMPADKHNWLRRKANVAKYFEESSLAVRHTLEKRRKSLRKPFGLYKKEYVP